MRLYGRARVLSQIGKASKIFKVSPYLKQIFESTGPKNYNPINSKIYIEVDHVYERRYKQTT